jgi:hypothetical protein
MKYLILLCSILLFSCGSPADGLEDLDLMKEGIPLKIKAPTDAVIKQKDMGIFKDITVKKGEDFYVQITAAQLLSSDLKTRKDEELSSVKELSVFSKVISEDERGFIFEKKKGEDMTYDFRSIKFIGNDEYLFQSGLVGNFSLEEVEVMYDAVK